MKQIIKSEYSKLFIAGLLINIVCAWFSNGFYHYDEHFQILEFCNYKLGLLPASEVPWELKYKVRSTILPYIVYAFTKALVWIGVNSPFTVIFLIRLLTGIAAWWVTSNICLLLIPKMKTQAGKKLLILMSMFLWFVPFLNVRFSAENIAGLSFLYGLYFILRSVDSPKKSALDFIWAGLFFGLSSFIRVQLIFAIGGLLVWVFFIKKTEWKYLLIITFSALVAVGINYLLDWMFYGTPVFTPFNYFYANIVLHRAEHFGTSPWWFYIEEYIIKLAPPLSVFLLIFFLIGIYNYYSNPMVLAIVPFILAHFFVSHKEWRFMFPVANLFIYVCALGLDHLVYMYPAWFKRWTANKSNLKILKYIYAVSVLINIPFLIYRTLIPAEASVNYCKYLYYNAIGSPPVIFILRNTSDYTMTANNASFYKSPRIKIVSVQNLNDISDYLHTNKLESAYYIDKTKSGLTYQVPGYIRKNEYCIYPDWLLNWNINNWQNRTQLWFIYKFTRI